MTSRERLIRALNHKEADRIPIDLGATQLTGIMAVEYRKLRRHLGLATDRIRVFDLVQQLALVDRDIIERFGVDVVMTSPHSSWGWKKELLSDGAEALFPEGYQPETLEDGSKVLRDLIGYFGYNYNLHPTLRMPKDGDYYDMPFHPLENAETEADIDNFKLFWEISEKDLKRFEDKIDQYLRETPYGIVANTFWGGWGQHYEALQNLRGWDKFLMDLYSNKKLARYMLEKRHEAILKRWDVLLKVIGDKAQVVTMGDDMGMQDRPQISLEIYRELLKPFHKSLLSFIKKRTKAKVWMHNCGNIWEYIPDLIEVGVDILNPVQVTAAQMDSRKLKKEFREGHRVLGGSCDTQRILPFGTPAEVRDEVKRRIDDLAPGGGFVFAPIMGIQIDVPVEKRGRAFRIRPWSTASTRAGRLDRLRFLRPGLRSVHAGFMEVRLQGEVSAHGRHRRQIPRDDRPLPALVEV